MTPHSLRSLDAKEPGQAAGDGQGVTGVCFRSWSSCSCPGSHSAPCLSPWGRGTERLPIWRAGLPETLISPTLEYPGGRREGRGALSSSPVWSGHHHPSPFCGVNPLKGRKHSASQHSLPREGVRVGSQARRMRSERDPPSSSERRPGAEVALTVVNLKHRGGMLSGGPRRPGGGGPPQPGHVPPVIKDDMGPLNPPGSSRR